MAEIDLGSDDGMVSVTFGGVEVPVDLFDARNRLSELGKKHLDRPDHEWRKAVADYMVSLGFPEVSHRVAQRFSDAVCALYDRVKKNTSDSPRSPDSTASTPEP